MVQKMNEITDWLEEHTGSTLSIRKEELAIGKQDVVHIDQIELQLDEISVRNIDQSDPDDYLASQEVILRGEGKIRTATGEAELPQNVYEIPLDEKLKTQRMKDGLKIETGRAHYSINIH